MSSIKQELLAEIEDAPDEALTQTLLFLKTLTRTAIRTSSNPINSSLDRFSELLQSEGCYEDENIDQCSTFLFWDTYRTSKN